MKKLRSLIALFALASTVCIPLQDKLEAVTYVTDTGGFAYDESRAATQLAPAIALGTVALVAIVALAVQNSHDSSSSSSSSSHFHATSASSN